MQDANWERENGNEDLAALVFDGLRVDRLRLSFRGETEPGIADRLGDFDPGVLGDPTGSN